MSTNQSPEIETRDRVRRIETRLTSLLVAMNVKTGVQRPTFAAGKLTVLSPHTSLKEVLDNIPAGWQYSVDVMLGNEKLMTVHRGELT